MVTATARTKTARGTPEHHAQAIRDDAKRDPESLFGLVLEVVWERGKLKFRCRHHGDGVDEHPSGSIETKGEKAGTWYCHVCEVGGDIFHLAQREWGCNFAEAVRRLAEARGLDQPPTKARKKARASDKPKYADREPDYLYRDETGRVLFGAYREPGKQFPQAVPENGRWRWGIGNTRRVLYRLPEVLAAIREGKPIYVCEGEKDVDNMWLAGFAATCNPGGASKDGAKWRPEYNEFLRGAKVVILCDADEAGRGQGLHIAATLHGIAASVKLLDLFGADVQDGADVSNFLSDGGTAEELRVLVEAAPDWQPPDPSEEPPIDAAPTFALTDSGNAELFAHTWGDQVCFDHRRGRWLLFDGQHWRPDEVGRLTIMAKDVARARYAAASKAEDNDGRKWAFSSESRSRIEATLALAKSEPPIADSGDVDLTTGLLRPGRPEDRITRVTGVDFDPDARAPRWERFLQEVFLDDGELMAFVQRAIGYSLSGSLQEQVWFLCYGIGCNGKSKFLGAIGHVLGGYAHEADFRLFDYATRHDHPEALAAIEGKRFVTASESLETARLNEARLKALSGGEGINAHLMRENSRTFPNTAKVWLCSNYCPRVNDDSPAFWRRVNLVPFRARYTFDPDEDLPLADLDLEAKLRAEAPGILAWVVRGARAWQEEGLRPPASVKAATEQYKAESDPLAPFLDEFCVVGPECRASAAEMLSAYLRHCERAGIPDRDRMSSTALGRRMGQRFEKKHTKRGAMYVGVGIREDEREPEAQAEFAEWGEVTG